MGGTSNAPEPLRLAALHATGILDTRPDKSFDGICELAQRLFVVPGAAIVFVDETRSWFKASVGCNYAVALPRRSSFSDHVVSGDHVFVVEDARHDDRFAHFPNVMGPPHVRFYAGAPILLEPGLRMGVVSITDTKPRTLDQAGRDALGVLATMVQTELLLLGAARRLHGHHS